MAGTMSYLIQHVWRFFLNVSLLLQLKTRRTLVSLQNMSLSALSKLTSLFESVTFSIPWVTSPNTPLTQGTDGKQAAWNQHANSLRISQSMLSCGTTTLSVFHAATAVCQRGSTAGETNNEPRLISATPNNKPNDFVLDIAEGRDKLHAARGARSIWRPGAGSWSQQKQARCMVRGGYIFSLL